ncbi:Fic family protein [Levilactobacillus yonginensis]|uniref:Fic family protein n=1 Tax=Levilactobacillus yonginensis TaxID=1054041 RepID=UPI000F778D6D|nr:Fic family protein [Levilactobacillus yonginensis]
MEINKLVELNALRDNLEDLQALSDTQSEELDLHIKLEHVWTSNAIEGNSLTLPDVTAILTRGTTLKGGPVKDLLETLDLSAAYDYMQQLATDPEPLSTAVIRSLNRLVMQRTAVDKPGTYRVLAAWPYGHEDQPYSIPADIAAQMDELIVWAHEAQGALHPVLYAADLHQRFVAIHPFIDGNGRTARLLMNLALVSAGYPVISVQPDQVARDTYMQALAKSREMGDLSDFEDLIAGYVKTELERLIDMLRLNHQKQANFKSGIEEALEDVKNGNVTEYHTAAELMQHLTDLENED